MKKNWFVIVFILLLAIILVIYKTRGTFISNLTPTSVNPNVNQTQPIERKKTIDVVAENNSFTPKILQSQLGETLIINVTAKDREYAFKVKGYPRLDTVIPKGQMTPVTIQFLGVGEYTFTCGNACSGKIVVEQIDDENAND